MPFLAVLGVGALVGVAGYLGYRAVKHFVFKEPWGITTKGVIASLAAGAIALPAIMFGSGILAGAAGVELTGVAMGGATSIVGAVTGNSAGAEEKEPARPAPPQINPNFNPFAEPAAEPAPVTTATEPAAETPPETPPEDTTANNPETPVLVPDEPKPEPKPQEQQQARPETYTVQSGDTLTAIARDQGVSLQQLEQANPQLAQRTLPKGFSSPWDYIRTGEKIFLPPSETPGMNGAFSRMAEPERVK